MEAKIQRGENERKSKCCLFKKEATDSGLFEALKE
jgi:hypothetical protein